ncbi:MAG: DNA topoisomerase IB [Gemmatimonadaceae bacterium]
MANEWIRRRGGKSAGFRYEDARGHAVRDRKQLGRIDALRVPPAWRDVHIAASSRAAIQAWGFDVKGRKQYRYHERAVAQREQRKYHRLRRLARDLPAIREALYTQLGDGRELTRDRVAAGVVRLISKGFFRPGNERYTRENHTFGITTLTKRHARVDGNAIAFAFRGKSNKNQRRVVVDRALAKLVQSLLRTPGTRLFRYTADGTWHNLTQRDVNEYVRRLTPAHYTAKDFRTWGGTLRVAMVLSDLGPAATEREAKKNVVLAVRLVAAELGNTPAICRASYVHPIVLARYLDHGDTILARLHGKTAAGHYPEERALIRFLDRHFPERRRRARPDAAPAPER